MVLRVGVVGPSWAGSSNRADGPRVSGCQKLVRRNRSGQMGVGRGGSPGGGDFRERALQEALFALASPSSWDSQGLGTRGPGRRLRRRASSDRGASSEIPNSAEAGSSFSRRAPNRGGRSVISCPGAPSHRTQQPLSWPRYAQPGPMVSPILAEAAPSVPPLSLFQRSLSA